MKKDGVLLRFDKQTWEAVMTTRRNIISKAHVVTIKCKFCDSMDVYHFGYTKKGTQRYICTNCRKTFIDNKAPIGMRFPTEAIATALNMFYESASLGKIQRQLELIYGVRPYRSTIYRWITIYSQKAAKTLGSIPIPPCPREVG